MAPKPTGRDEVMAAVVEAAVPLLAEMGPAGVRTRDIARAANVNHALLYRHFESKEGLIRAVLAETGRVVSDAVAAGTRRDGLRGSVEAIAEHRMYMRVLARLILDAQEGAGELSQFPVMRQLMGDPADLTPEQRADAVLVASAIMGWMLFEDYLLEAVGGSDVERKRIRNRLPELAGYLASASNSST